MKDWSSGGSSTDYKDRAHVLDWVPMHCEGFLSVFEHPQGSHVNLTTWRADYIHYGENRCEFLEGLIKRKLRCVPDR